MKLLLISALAVACLAEPPVNRYLPPQQGGLGGPPSTSYGAPVQKQTDAVFNNRQSSRPGNQYIPPQPSSTYGAPSQPQFSAPSAQYGAPGQGIPSSQYGVPSAPSSQYGAPGFGGSGTHSQSGFLGGQGQSRQYLPPGSGGTGGYAGDEGINEPANYSFEYMVKDDASGNDFGHRESRQGDRAEGQYYVLLPDGRKQTVKYEADENGYKPRISYEDTGLGQGGYGRNSQSGYNYENQGGPY
ncbi:unnamed protein product [Arctia plantaginis]|uniref:Pro-resilin n=1 Tax=Arctia plantaginis TaxID=874455 RepID=A0A8S1BA78_ARCPL|nr:unnamed protein product [Arctia plantaginis]